MITKKKSTSTPPSNPAEKSNAKLPRWLSKAFNTPCPFCGNAPMIEIFPGEKCAFVCHDNDCPVQPEAPAGLLKNAADSWTSRAERWNELIIDNDIRLDDLSAMELYGMAKRFYIGANQIEPLSASLED